MDAVAILTKIEQYFDRNHSLFMRFGGLFAMIFFMLYIPYNMLSRVTDKLEAQQNVSIALAYELQHMSSKMQFLELSYDDKKKVMREVECLAQNIYFEAGGEPIAGKIGFNPIKSL